MGALIGRFLFQQWPELWAGAVGKWGYMPCALIPLLGQHREEYEKGIQGEVSASLILSFLLWKMETE